MEADLLHGLEQPLSRYKSHIRNPMKMKIHQPLIPRPYENILLTDSTSMGILKAPPLPLLHSYPPPYSLQPPPQPPLLPLPASHLRRTSSALGPACSPANRSGSRTRDHSFPPKKTTKSLTKNIPKKEEKKTPKKSSDTVTVSSTRNLGSDSKELPKNIAKISRFDSVGDICSSADSSVIDSLGPLKAVEDQVDMFPGFGVFTISPPPSSLPLPTFSLRPKLSCNAVAAGVVDTGATDDLRRLLRLQ